MRQDLSKSDKKAARNVIDLSLVRELEQGVKEFDALLSRWKSGSLKTDDTYWDLTEAIRKHNKLIRRRYGDIRCSTYLTIILGLMADEIIHENDLKEFSEETREYLISLYQNIYK